MIRLSLIGLGFVGVTTALLIGLAPSPDDTPASETVTRADPTSFDLSPALPIDAPQPNEVAATAMAAQPDVMVALRELSYALLTNADEPAVAVTAAVAPAQHRYIVQPGDSLPGIAFRHYGTTAAYPQLLSANETLLSSPADLEAGMILSIPKIE